MARDEFKWFYQSKQWKNVRQYVLRRDLYTCQECHSKRATEIHHVIPLSTNNIYNELISLNPDNLLSLCHNCHTRITKGVTGDVDKDYIFGDDGQVIVSK